MIFKKELSSTKEDILAVDDVMQLGLPQGIKGIEEYKRRYDAKEDGLRVPGHVMASMFYNLCLENYGAKESMKIVSGTKIKKFYLSEKFGPYNSIAIPTDTKTLPPWFVEHFVPLISRDRQGIGLIDNPLKAILTAIGERIPTRKSLLFDSVVEY